MDRDERIEYCLEAISIDIHRIADTLEVMAGARTINEIRHKSQCDPKNRYFLYSRVKREKIDCGSPCWYTEFMSVENGFKCHKCLKFFPLEEYYC